MNTTSPGTSVAAGTCTRRPSRSTRASSVNIAVIASSERSAFPSCQNPIATLIATTARITPASIQWPSRNVVAIASSRT
jgi:hypothetical protein